MPVAVIVTHNSARDLPALLAGLAGAGLPAVVVDNDSGDDTVALAREAGARVLETGANLGYAGALNVAWRHVGAGEAVLVLNPDSTVDRESVTALLAAVDDGVGVAVPLIRETSGAVAHSRRYEPSRRRALVDALLGRRAAWLPSGWSETEWAESAYRSGARAPEWTCGAALLITARCRKLVGDWDERFFLYSEEVDFFRRVRETGLRTVFVPEATVTHHGGGSGSGPALTALLAVNRVRYFAKYHGRAASAVFRALVVLHELLRSRDAGHRFALKAVLTERIRTR
ncbi:glycosyltransferase family 2 protein [Amycolatopsis magusensis]|nr:glycosyltransferase family 2 protein [Amycolatopsis magusensis]